MNRRGPPQAGTTAAGQASGLGSRRPKANRASSTPGRRFLTVTRLAWLTGELLLAALNFARLVRCRREQPEAVARARWLQAGCRRILRVLGVHLRVHGAVPTTGVLVCNHLSYLDILAIGALAPAVFVAKREVRRWPILGWFARRAGTVFVHRERRADVIRANAEVEAALECGTLVVIFPEGTSSDGASVLPFKSSLLEPAARRRRPLSAGFVRYTLDDGEAGEEVCYWRDMTLLPHLLRLLGKRAVNAQLSCTRVTPVSGDRKELARQLHAEVVRLKRTCPA